MVLVFILFGIIIFFILVSVIIILSSIQIQIKNLEIGNKENKKNNNIKDNYEVKISLYFLGRIPILWFRLNNKKMRKIYNSKQLQKIDFKKVEKNIPLNKETFKILKYIRLKKLKLYLKLGTEDAVITSYIVALIASVIGIILPHIANKEQINKCHYEITPLYQGKNEYNLYLDGIIYIKIVHIIYSMLIFVKKGRDKNERTSNRRSYAYRYE